MLIFTFVSCTNYTITQAPTSFDFELLSLEQLNTISQQLAQASKSEVVNHYSEGSEFSECMGALEGVLK